MSLHAMLKGSLPGTLLALVLGAGGFLPSSAAADSTASALQFIVVSDDIQKKTTEVARPSADGGDDGSPAAPAPAAAPAGGSGKGNNGHGNNADGVDSSNPGQGQGGPNGAVDPSGGVDDEAGGGGASPSQNGGGGKTNASGGKKK